VTDAIIATPRSALGTPGAMVVIISGPSGVGKDTILRWLKMRPASPERHFVVTYKTRPPRHDEVHGVHYNFVSDVEFRRLRETGALLEASPTHDHWAGTPRDQVADAIEAGRDAILKIDVQGADKVKDQIPDAIRIFVMPPSEAEREQRIKGRKTESPESLEQRKRDAEVEMGRAVDYDYVVVNHTGKAYWTARKIDKIIREEHARHPTRRISF
jgi:guanylate kinase